MKKAKKIFILSIGLLFTSCVYVATESSSGSSSVGGENTSDNSLIENSESINTSLTSDATSNDSSNSSSENVSSDTSSITSSSLTSSSSGSSNDKPTVDAKITSYGVYAEAAYMEWQESNISSVKVEYKLSNESSFTSVDKELIRKKNNSTARVDVLGLKAAQYDFRITTSNNEILEMKNVSISNYDRSGYAHFNTSTAIGGYNNDGTVKKNATIVYVNEENKNTVDAKIGSKTYKGLSNILQAQSSSSNPLIIRIIGEVSAATWNQIQYKKGSSNLSASDIVDKNGKALPTKNMSEDDIISGGYNTLNTSTYSKLNGLTNKIKYSSGEFDSYYNMLDISGANNVTVEGVGDDAMIFQWGFTWKSCSYIEVRNLIFDDYTEDACGFEGGDDATSLSGFKTGHIWVHNNRFNEGKNYWDVCPEQDKFEGDGATDLKKNAYITISYNHYYMNHKTGLVGGGDAQHTASITFHHNFYDQCTSRLPLGRQANMHMYNNYYYNTKNTSMSIRAGAYAFVENCYFEGGKNPMETKSGDSKNGAIKSYQNTFENCSGTNNGTKVTKREQTISNDNIYDKTFDTNTKNFYYDATNKVSDVSYLTSAEQAKSDAKNYAGPMHINPSSNSSETVTPTPTPTGEQEILNIATLNLDDSEVISKSFSNGIFTINASSSKMVSIKNDVNYYSSFDSSYTSELKFGGTGSKTERSIGFTLDKSASIKIYARSANTSTERQLAIYNDDKEIVKQFDPIISATELSYDLSSGSYYIASVNSGMNIAAIVINYNN